VKFILKTALILLCLVAVSPVARSQGNMMQPPQIMGIWNPVVGSGATYQMQKGSEPPKDFTFALVGKDSVDGKDAYWVEMSFDGKRGNMLMKMLMTEDEGTHVSRMIMQIPGQSQPIEISGQMLEAHQHDQMQDLHNHGTNIGAETITVPAGTFLCDHWKSEAGDEVWVSPKVPPYGLVKLVPKDGDTMVLTKVITDAKDKITGTPIRMDQMGGMGRPH
jgi:hypothetical protein